MEDFENTVKQNPYEFGSNGDNDSAAQYVSPASCSCAENMHNDVPGVCAGGNDARYDAPDARYDADDDRYDSFPEAQLDESMCASRNSVLGRKGEEAARRYLVRRGYDIVECNWKCAVGEVDIIAKYDDTLVFVEVKTRSDIKLGMPSEAVGDRKRDKYEKLAALYLRDHQIDEAPLRFDVIGILVTGTDRALLRHHINAFGSGC